MQSNDSNQGNDDIGADIAASIEKLKEASAPETEAPIDVISDEPAVPVEAEKPKPERKSKTLTLPDAALSEDVAPEVPAAPKYNVPQGYSAVVKEKWNTLPPEVQADLVRREEDFHKMVTARDGELNLGREIKDVITPYMPIIQAEGSTPKETINNLLNTAYVLRTGRPEQKQHIVRAICEQYDIPVEGLVRQQEYVDPTVAQLQQELAALRQQADPNVLFSQLQEQQERANIHREADAFVRDPANIYFEKVKPYMAAFLTNGDARNYKEAYDMACQAHPEVRSILEANAKAAEAEKRKAEIRAKQHAASSVTGSPATPVSNTSNSTNDIESAVRAAMRSVKGTI